MKISTVLTATGLLFMRAYAQSPVTTELLTENLARLESVREIKNVQRTFAQLAHYGRFQQMASFFADNGILRWGNGTTPGINVLDDSDAINITGPAAIESWLRTDSGKMDGLQPGSLNLWINEQPVISLSEDAKSAKGRWHILRWMGDGQGNSRIEGGMFENQYVLVGDRWKISLLRYYPSYAGNYRDGWRNVGGNRLPIVPYHYTPDSAGIPILNFKPAASPQEGEGKGKGKDKSSSSKRAPPKPQKKALSPEELVYRISQLNEEDEVRNLVHQMGYYVDQRMWPDVVDLFTPNGTITVDSNTSPPGPAGLQSVLNRMGPDGITRGILNEHPIYMTTVELSPDGTSAIARGLEIGMIGDHANRSAQWQFCTYRHTLIRDPDTSIWKIQSLNYSRLLVAEYAAGWASGGLLPLKTTPPTPPPFNLNFLNHSTYIPRRPESWTPQLREGTQPNASLLPDLSRRLLRSSSFDETENLSSAYGHYADDIRCQLFGDLHAQDGFKASPGIGWYRSPQRITQACAQRYGPSTTSLTPAPRNQIPFHWRIQLVVLTSNDGRSSTSRCRNLQTGTGLNSTSGFSGLAGFNGGIYHDQMVLEEFGGNLRRKIWSLTIDEFYWNSASWGAGWANVDRAADPSPLKQRMAVEKRQASGSLENFPPDLSVKDPAFGTRYQGFMGGPPPSVSWPNVLPMYWEYRNPVSGRVPVGNTYWGPGCVPCRVKNEWFLTNNGYEEPPTGPTFISVNATVDGETVVVNAKLSAGPEETIWGYVELRNGNRSANLMGEALLDNEGFASFTVPRGDLKAGEVNRLVVYYAGNDRVKPARGAVDVLV